MLEKLKIALPDAIEITSRRAPVAGVFAFSACSVHAVAHMLFDAAKHDTPLYWVAAALIELATAWLITRIIERFREATRSIGRGFAKQDRRFARGTLVMYAIFVLPSFITSVAANYIEFKENLLLAFLFPVLTAACAAGAAMPGIIEGRKRRKESDESTTKKEQAAKKDEQAAKMAEQATKMAANQRRTLAELGRAADVLRILAEDPAHTRADIATKLRIAPQTVSYHLTKLEEKGLIDRSNGSVKLPDGLAELLEEKK